MIATREQTIHVGDAKEWLGRVYEGDSRELAAMLPDGCLDAIITSPPYPQGKKKAEDQGRYRRSGTADQQREQIHDGFRHGEPNLKGETGLEVRIPAADWLDWFLSFEADWRRILKPNGNLIVNVDSCCYPTRHRHWGVFSLPERMEQRGWCFVEAGPWVKLNGPPTSAPGRFHHSWEFWFHFSNGDRWSINLAEARTPHAKAWGPDISSQWRERGGGRPAALPHPEGARPKDVFVCSVGGTRWHPLGGAHHAAMPLALAEWLVAWASRPGDLLFDPFLGAATTVVAAIRLGRRWLGAELTPRAATVARRRVQLATQGYFDEGLEPEGVEQRQLRLGRD